MNQKKKPSSSHFEDELARIELEQHRDHLWDRPSYHHDPVKNIIFQQIEIDHYQEKPSWSQLPRELGSLPSLPIFKIFGVTNQQNTILCHVHGFLPYLYIPAPIGMDQEDCDDLKNILDAFKVELVQKSNLYGYSPGLHSFCKITVTSPTALSSIKRTVEQGISFGKFSSAPHATFESNLSFVMRFMIDLGITGMNWMEIPSSSASAISSAFEDNNEFNTDTTLPFEIRSRETKTSSCQLELDIMYDKLISHLPEDNWSSIAPLRVLSFDIECAGRKGIFPEAQIDPVIQIAGTLTIHGNSQPIIRAIFVLGSCSQIPGATVFTFDSESDMLIGWMEFIRKIDPDVLIGYNILNFDLPYLLDRSAAIKCNQFQYLGRLYGVQTKARDSLFSSKAHGTRESKTINIDGRIIFDILQVMQRDYKLRSYSLNSVSAHFLGEQKEDVPHSIITDLFNGNADTRKRLAVYCLKDAFLPQRLMDRLMCLINYVEMARVTGVPFNYLLSRGQQVKVISQLYRKAADEGYVIPAMRAEISEEQYEGATVIEPEKGYYDVPIAILDFASLYPSIIMAHNLCYNTLTDKATIEKCGLKEDVDYIRTPSDDYFVKPSIRKGLLPIILEDLLSTRKRAKADLKNEKDPFKKAVLDGRQLALKISANSVYGFTGASVGKLPCIQISQSVTSYGRKMIEKAKKLVEQKFTKENNYKTDAKVIYGDTDSIMIKFGLSDLASVMELGREAAKYITSHFDRPISLEFEKCYFPYLLIQKKRYAGLYWTGIEKYDKLDAKGIETVRRDNCQLVERVIDSCLRKILIDRDIEAAKNYAKQIISDLLQNRVDLSLLVITKALSKSGEEYAGKQAHVELAERMKKRDAGSAPALGDRVPYVIIRGNKGAAAYEKSEDPIYVLENNIPIDTKYYLENQLSKPLMRIFEPIMNNPQELLSGEHTRTVHQGASSLTGIMAKFATRKATCIGCKATLSSENTRNNNEMLAIPPSSQISSPSSTQSFSPNDDHSTIGEENDLICDHCKPRLSELYMRQMSITEETKVRFARLWTQCQRCQGSLHEDVLCTSRDCPIFYMRKRAQRDVEEASKTFEKFYNVDWLN